MVFQAPNPFPTMSIYDNVAAGLNLNSGRLRKSEKDGIVERALRGAHLWDEVKDRLDKPGTGLSGGQQQRLCIARAIAVEPEVLLMDEPCSALDPVATLAIEDLIGELKSKYTIVIVTHNMQQAARASDLTAFFNLEETGKPGRLVEIGPTEKIFTQPAREGDRGLRQRPLRLRAATDGARRDAQRIPGGTRQRSRPALSTASTSSARRCSVRWRRSSTRTSSWRRSSSPTTIASTAATWRSTRA